MRSLLRSIRQFLSELRRRNVYRVALAYLAASFVAVELAEIASGAFGLPGWFEPMVWTVCGIGFPIAVVLAWALEVTPEEVRVEEGDGAEEVAQRPEGFSVTSTGLIAGLLIVAIGLLLSPRIFSSAEGSDGQVSVADTTQIDERSIAVLPFEPLSSGEKSQTFARGVHDDLLTRLSNVSDLQVFSRQAVRQFQDTDLTTGEIADSLGVRWVLEGGVQVLQDQIQVNAQLIDPRNETHAWADDYQRDLTAEDLFAIQGEITGEIADALKAELTAGEQSRIAGAPTENLKAYRLYVKGRSQLDTRTEDGMCRAVNYFQQAIQEDSTFALAWSGLADVQGLRTLYGPDSLGASVPSHKKAALRALQIDPDLAEAHASMGLFYLQERDAPAALRHLERSIELKPSYAQAHHWLGLLELVIGSPKKGLRRTGRAVNLNPQQWAANVALTLAYLATGQPKEALAQSRKTRPISARPPFATGAEVGALHRLGRLEEAQEVAKRALSKADSSGQTGLRIRLAMAEVAAGSPTRARTLIAADRGGEVSLLHRGLLEAALGQTDAAFEAFRNVEEWTDNQVMPIRYFYPDLLGSMRTDPRFEELIREINQQWGLNPDGSIPEESETAIEPQADA